MTKFKTVLTAITVTFCFVLSAHGDDHSFTGLPIDSNGWTDFQTLVGTGYSAARVLFVSSSSGNDTNAANNILSNGHYGVSDVTFDSNGMFQAPAGAVPFATISTAYAYCRDGYPDILLLERGGEWTAGLGVNAVSGTSQTTPHIIASYGTSGDRPKLTNTLISAWGADYLIISGIHFYSHDWTTAGRGIDTRTNSTYQTFEDLFFEQKAGDIVQGQSGEYCQYIAFRRCIWTHGEAHDGQLFAQQSNHVLLEECFFHEPYDEDFTDESRFGRHFYFTSEGTSGPEYHDYLNNVIIRGCIFYHAERGGADYRSGGNFHYNLVVAENGNTVGGYGGSSGTIQSADVQYNVFLEGPPNVTGYNNLSVYNIDGGVFNENIFSDGTNMGPYGTCISLGGDSEGLYIARNIEITNNIFYGRPIEVQFSTDSRLTDVQNIAISGNDFQAVNGGRLINHLTWDGGLYRFEEYTYSGNRYYSTNTSNNWFGTYGDFSSWITANGETGSSSSQVSYTAPDRTVGTYNESIGGPATTSAFITAALGQSRHNWNSDLMAMPVINYIRAGFGKDHVSYNYDFECEVSDTTPPAAPTGLTVE